MSSFTQSATRSASCVRCALAGLLTWASAGAVGVGVAVAAPEMPDAVASRDLALHFELQERGAAPIQEYILYYTRDDGQTWERHEAAHSGSSPFSFTAPSDGRYGFALVARDELGRGSAPPQPGTPPEAEVVVDTTPPELEVPSPVDGSGVYSSLPMEIRWSASDAHLGERPVDVSYSIDGKPWRPLWEDAPASDERRWPVPFTQGELRLRLRARDRLGNVTEQVTHHGLTLLSEKDDASRLVLVRARSNQLTVPVYYRFQDDEGEPLAPDELRAVRLWYRSGPGAWSDGGLDLDRNSPASFRAPRDGLFELYVTAADHRGRRYPAHPHSPLHEPPPPELAPHASVLIDTLEPTIEILEPPAGARVPASSPLRVRFAVTDANPLPRPPQLRYSLDGGESWRELPASPRLEPLQRDGVSLGVAEFRLPSIDARQLLLAVTQEDIAGNVGGTTTDPQHPIAIESRAEDPRDVAAAHYRRARVLFSQPDPQEKRESLQHFQAALEAWEPLAAVHHDLAVALEWTAPEGTLPPQILQHYERATELDPQNDAIRCNLIAHLLDLAGELPAGSPHREDLERRAREAFSRIDVGALESPPRNEAERARQERLRERYEKWKPRLASP